jgi:actin-like ATPase involved in cell morphogenesis
MLFSLCVWVSIDYGTAFTKGARASEEEIFPMAIPFPTAIGFRTHPGFNSTNPRDLTASEAHFISPEYGEKAITLSETRPTQVIFHFPDLVELNDTYQRFRATQLHTFIHPARVSIRDASAIFYKRVIDSIAPVSDVKDIILVVPATYNYHQRRQLELGLGYLGYANFIPIDEVEAVAYVFANDRPTKLGNVLFVDIGAAYVRAYVLRFSSVPSRSGRSSHPSVDRLSYEFNYETGGIFLTLALADRIKQKIGIENCTAAEDRRIVNAAERLKLALSNGENASVFISDIRGADRPVEVTVAEFTTIVAPFAAAVVDIAKRAVGGAKVDIVEVIGGGSKLKQMRTALRAALGLPVGTTLDPDTTLTKGGGYFAQFYHSASRFPDVAVNEPASLQGVSLMTVEDERPIVERGQPWPEAVEIPPNHQIFMFTVDAKDSRPGLRSNGFGFFIDPVPEKVKLFLRQRPFEIQNTQHCNASGCFQVRLQPSLNPETPSELIDLFASSEVQAELQNRTIKKTLDLAVRVLGEVANNRSFRVFSSHDDRLSVIKKAEAAKKCAEDFSRSCKSFAQITANFTNLEAAIAPVYARMRANESAVHAYNVLLATVQLARNATQFDWPRTKPFLRPRTLARFLELTEEQEQFLAFGVNRTRSQPRWKDLEIGPDDYNGRTVRLFSAYEQVEAMTDDESGDGDEWTDPFGGDPFAEGEGRIPGLRSMALRSISSRLGDTLTAKRKEWFGDPEAL